MNNTLSPKELAQAIGVSESSLKRWVDEGLITAVRTSGGHRRIPRNSALAFVRERGYPLLRPDLLGLETASGGPAGGAIDTVFHAALREGRGTEAQRLVVQRFVAGDSVATLIDDVIAPAMRAIGELWQNDSSGIYIEHRALSICTRILNRLRDLLPEPSPHAPLALGGAPENERYTLPSLMAATVIAAEGWRTSDLGAHVPATVLARAAAEEQARMVWLSLAAASESRDPGKEIEAVQAAFAATGIDPELVVGGPAFGQTSGRPPEPVRFAESMAELAGLARGLRG